MTIKLLCNTASPPIAALAIAEVIKTEYPVEITWGKQNVITIKENSQNCDTVNDVCRILARESPKHNLYGSSAIEKTQVDHWLTYSLSFNNDIPTSLFFLDKILGPITYLVANKLTIADLVVFGTLHSQWNVIIKKPVPNNVQRWFNLIKNQAAVQAALKGLPKDLQDATPAASRASVEKTSGRNQEGKFLELPDAEHGKVVVRFPPEASGYLHIGHAKAALLNQYYQQNYNGKLIMRFDDTNPAKENLHFEKVILQDLEMLEIKFDLFTHTSQYFDLMLEYCEQLLKNGKAYVDDTEPEQMKAERDALKESVNRNNTVEKNFTLWNEMLKGSAAGQKCCVRVKINMQSPNGCLRDPTIYRCKNEPHPRTGTKYKVYPTYDFACPIVDAIEGVTHTLRTMEYHDRNDQFNWFIDALNLRKPVIWDYARLSMTNTVLSKRKLTWFVEEGLVDGWDDPRFPTVRGVLRRGMTVEGLKQFIIAQGSSRTVVFMEWDKIWAFNKKVIDPIAPRYTALELDTVPVTVKDVVEQSTEVNVHPKDASIGTKAVWTGPRILIDRVDAEQLKEGENATFINWGNLIINKINKTDGKITSIDATPNLENKDFKKTLKLTWLCETAKAPFTKAYCVFFEHIINKAVLAKDEDFKQYIGHETRTEIEMLGDPELRKLKKGDIIQLQRRGFFKVDVPYVPISELCGKEQPIILFHIPDGHTKEMPTANKPKSTVEKKKSATAPKPDPLSAQNLNEKIVEQGNTVRHLKSKKATKVEIDEAVKVLLDLKKKFKSVSGLDWKPDCFTQESSSSSSKSEPRDLNSEITKQGNLVRDLKSSKAPKSKIDEAVKHLLYLKSAFKSETGSDWKPAPAAAPPSVPASSTEETSSTDPSYLNSRIVTQGNIVRDLKSNKASKEEIGIAVKTLLNLKLVFKEATGSDWKPELFPVVVNSPDDSNILNDKICQQGDLVRDLKKKQARKGDIDSAVNALLQLKAEFKKTTGEDWKPKPKPVACTESDISFLNEEIRNQGDIVRNLKSQKATKAEIDAAVIRLLALKTDFKDITGKDWTPDTKVTNKMKDTNDTVKTEVCSRVEHTPKRSSPQRTSSKRTSPKRSSPSRTLQNESIPQASSTKDSLTEEITIQANIVRDIKARKAPKEEITEAVNKLLSLKAEYKNIVGTDFPVVSRTASAASSKSTQKKEQPKKQKPEKKHQKEDSTSGPKKQTRLCLEATKEDNLPEWYSQVLTKGDMIEYYDVSGCYILRPWSFAIWKFIKKFFEAEIEKLGVKECYFPIFVSKSVLEKEKTHIADFAPEVAWVTKSGDTDLAEPIAVRPTSETVMYPAYAKWIQSYRDLPLKLNQWNNVVRWEFSNPQPFLRTREFLWQEGHTAFATKEEADEEVLVILDLYAQVYTDLLAIPVVKGRKSEKEKFAGGNYTTSVEAFVSASGRGIQGATSHHLGQNFAKMFQIEFEDPDTQTKQYAYQNSWGLSTRTIGVVIMVHADNQGLVLPPRVAEIQVVIIPCGLTVSLPESEKFAVQASCYDLEQTLKGQGIRVEGDYRDNYSPGWKFNHWELKGVPIRIELGPKDINSNQFVAVRRDTGEKLTFSLADAKTKIAALLDKIHASMLAKATKEFKDHTIRTKNWDQLCSQLDQKNVLLSPFCGHVRCEEEIRTNSASTDAEPGAPAMGAKTLCIPFQQDVPILDTDKCINPLCKHKPTAYALFGRSY